MNQEVIRRHYLEAMGITAWASKYQLPNALPTQACEWEESTPAPMPPRERLQALLDDAPAPRRQAPESQPAEAIASPSAVRALLLNELKDKPGSEKQGQVKQNHVKQNPIKQSQAKQVDAQSVTAESAVDVTPAAPAKPLKFSLSCLCLNGRWLVLQTGKMSSLEQQLLANLLQAAGIQQSELPEVTHFTWPQMTNAFAVEDPLDEAREGLAAFIAGRVSRQDWQLERLLWWGELGAEQAPLDRILNVSEDQSHTLSLPVWQGPALGSLLDGTTSKRELWPALQALSQQWKNDNSTTAEPTIDGH